MAEASGAADARQERSVATVFFAFLRLGLTAFGGPVAHLGFFREEFVVRRRWLDEHAYADLVSLCQFLPGPASSQAGFAIGLLRSGGWGGLAAWLGFTIPSAFLMVLVGYGVVAWRDALPPGVLGGLKVAALVVVVQALWGMARTLCPDRPRATLAAAATALAVTVPGIGGQLAAIALGAVAGAWVVRADGAAPIGAAPVAYGRSTGIALLALALLLLIALPLLAARTDGDLVRLFDSFYRSGALVFGGGHVVLPLLEAEVASPGWLAPDVFLAGYGAAQALPGPLFAFAAFAGTAMTLGGGAAGGWAVGLLCLAAIFLPGLLLVAGALPFWSVLRGGTLARRVLGGVNAAVVGLLGAAVYDPVWTQAVGDGRDFALAVGAFLLLVIWRLPPWAVVAASAAGGWAVAALA